MAENTAQHTHNRRAAQIWSGIPTCWQIVAAL